MRRRLARPSLALLFIAPLLAACLERGQSAMPETLAQDDDSYCRAGGTVTPGSPRKSVQHGCNTPSDPNATAV